MKVTGYKLREALKRWQLRRDTALSQFPKVLTAFPGEKKPAATEISEAAVRAERAIAALQVAQMRYNLAVWVQVGDGTVTLAEVIKRHGGVARVEKLWRTASAVKEQRFDFHRNYDTRKADEIVAQRTVSYEDAGKQAVEFGAWLGQLREAIAIGNASEKDIEDLDAALLG